MRKISPSISIYKFPITAISSITNRLTGIYLSGCIFLYCSFDLLNEYQKNIIYKKYFEKHEYFQKAFNYITIYPFSYHCIGAIRHLIWDNYPKFLNNNAVAKSSKFIFLASIIPTIFIEKELSKKLKFN